MNRRLLSWIGLLALLLWTTAGAVAWRQAKTHWSIVVREGEPQSDLRLESDALQREALAALSGDVRALATLLEKNLGLLDEQDERRARELRASFAQELEPLRGRIERAQASCDAIAQRLELLECSLAAGRVPPTGSEASAELASLAPSVEELPQAPPLQEPEPPPRPSFLAFRLPSDDYRFDERRTWTIVPALSRAGFDAESTLHDFSGQSSQVSGELSVDLSRPGSAPAGTVRVLAKTLVTGEEGRDEGLREGLDVEHHAELGFDLARFEPRRVDAVARRVEGLAHGRMSIRGVEREVELAVKLGLDDANRLTIEGELELALPDYGVPVPSKLGLIRMQERVRAWFVLRARLEPRGES